MLIPPQGDDDRIGGKGLHLKEISVDELEAGGALAVDLQVALQHVQFISVDVVGNVFLEIASQVHGNAAHPAERLKHPYHLVLIHPLEEIEGDWFGNDRVPTFCVDVDALVELAEQEVSLIEVSVQFGCDIVPGFQLCGAVVIALK